MTRSRKPPPSHTHPEPPLCVTIDRRVLGIAALITAAVIVAYIPTYQAGFIWDDDDYILLDPLLTGAGGWAEIRNPTSGRNPQYYPLVFTTFLIERHLWGVDPTGYHVTNVVLHAANAVRLLVLPCRLKVPGGWVVAGLFALHPVCVESVAWVTERKNDLSTLFYLLAALSYLRFDDSGRWRWCVEGAFAARVALVGGAAGGRGVGGGVTGIVAVRSERARADRGGGVLRSDDLPGPVIRR